jgi:DUF1365 family protein
MVSFLEKGYVKARRSAIVVGSVYHARFSPREHSFTYPFLTLQIDLDELEGSLLDSRVFGFNLARLLSIRSDDYLCSEEGVSLVDLKLTERVRRLLAKQGSAVVPDRITLVTMPRLLGYVFNPVSFFLCFDNQDRLVGCVTQVHNTFGEAHIYPLVCQAKELPVEWRFPKAFFVSPFFDRSGEYRVVVESEGEALSIVVELFELQEGELKRSFTSKLKGSARSLTGLNIVKSLICYPIILFLTMPRIHIQALFLLFKVKLVPFIKPKPNSIFTIRSQQGRVHKVRLWFLEKMRRIRLKDS